MRFLLLLLAASLFANSFLLPSEMAWLAKQKPIVVGVTQIPNQVLRQNDKLTGFSIDLFKLLEQKIAHPITFRYYQTWQEVIEAAKDKEVDAIFLAQKTPSRLAYLDFTDTVLRQKKPPHRQPFAPLFHVR